MLGGKATGSAVPDRLVFDLLARLAAREDLLEPLVGEWSGSWRREQSTPVASARHHLSWDVVQG
jgi:hypothetical protein